MADKHHFQASTRRDITSPCYSSPRLKTDEAVTFPCYLSFYHDETVPMDCAVNNFITCKTRFMKLPKVLIGAIIAGIAVQTLPSCSKDKDTSPQKTEAQKKEEEKKRTMDPCPGCGMG